MNKIDSINYWTTKTGQRIAISNLSDQHLTNILKMIYRTMPVIEINAIALGYSALYSVQGEMATYCIEDGIRDLEENGVDPSEAYPQYEVLLDEYVRRELHLDALDTQAG